MNNRAIADLASAAKFVDANNVPKLAVSSWSVFYWHLRYGVKTAGAPIQAPEVHERVHLEVPLRDLMDG
jgi:hypothetical protein